MSGAREPVFPRARADHVAATEFQGIPTGVRWRLFGDTRPPLTATFFLGDLARRAAIGHAGRMLGADRVPPVISGHGVDRDPRHRHAFFLPEDADGDGVLDHVLITASAGFGRDAVASLATHDRLFDGRNGEWAIRCVWLGEAERAPSRLAGPSACWESVTPHVPPWHTRRGFTNADQIRREFDRRGLPAPRRLEQVAGPVARDGAPVRPDDFVLRLDRRTIAHGPAGRETDAAFWRLTFSEPVAGPLAIGWGCHFGLGLFSPSSAMPIAADPRRDRPDAADCPSRACPATMP
ncbi:type I-U CRISPR-associated protein Cas5/Cas6 [Skermanella sp. TT6]|uniref:Type I-U CRISPR-associated protein Cas5/Cas6 n=1 Tax=Skermanella cutis TaxID=2775420 RepID=A0ABX7B6A7_9PROT|nr:type I-U CRISPR-associated protein Csb2 [Skermanella sp. TT6]QQP88021.1 type I-U CRISPR-associated protein Cas5/Cas6 [Skermanella sp. TT6]